MSGRDDGGPAFPLPVDNDLDCAGRYASGYGGMSLRDHFAGEALKGMWSNAALIKPLPEQVMSDTVLSKMAYAQADAMLKERAK